VPAGNIMPNCTPVNVFNLGDPSQVERCARSRRAISTTTSTAPRSSISTSTATSSRYRGRGAGCGGLEYREQRGAFTTDFLTRSAPPLFLTCLLSGETCHGDSSAEYDVKEAYVEFFVPLLKDLPAIRSLNATAGVRYSDYSTFGSTTNAQFKVEYRPVGDLLLRVHTPKSSARRRSPICRRRRWRRHDLCRSVRGPDRRAGRCESELPAGVCRRAARTQLRTTEFADRRVAARQCGAPTRDRRRADVRLRLRLELGRNLSLTVDFWKYKLDDLIVPIDPNFAINQCVATGQSQFCDLVVRFPEGPNAGLIQQFFLRRPISARSKPTASTSACATCCRYTLRRLRFSST
jgi:hypothetical protein